MTARRGIRTLERRGLREACFVALCAAIAVGFPPSGTAAFGLLQGCGYRAVYASDSERLHVRLVRSLVPDPIGSDEVVAGMREELARSGALEAGEGYPCAEVEVLGMTEGSEGVAARASQPVARGMQIRVIARAWVSRGPGQSPVRDTGDVAAEDVLAVDLSSAASTASPPEGDPRSSVFHSADAQRAAARRLGRALGRLLLGEPAISD